MSNAPKSIAAILEKCPMAESLVVKSVELVAGQMAFDIGGVAQLTRIEIAVQLSQYARSAVAALDQLTELSGEERRALAVWSSRQLVEAIYQRFPKGPVLFALEVSLGGIIRNAIARFIGSQVTEWLDAFIELEVSKLRKADNP